MPDAVSTVPAILGDYLLWDSGNGIKVTSLLHPSASTGLAPSAGRVLLVADGQAAAVIEKIGTHITAQAVDPAALHLAAH